MEDSSVNKRSHSQFQRRSRERTGRRLAYLNSTIPHFIDPKSQSTCISLRVPLSAAIILDLYTEYASLPRASRPKEIPTMIEKFTQRLARNEGFRQWLLERLPLEQRSHLGI